MFGHIFYPAGQMLPVNLSAVPMIFHWVGYGRFEGGQMERNRTWIDDIALKWINLEFR